MASLDVQQGLDLEDNVLEDNVPEDNDRRSEGRHRGPRRVRRLCRRCGKRNAVAARYTWKRRVNRRRHHDLCSQCRRAVRDSARATPPPRH